MPLFLFKNTLLIAFLDLLLMTDLAMATGTMASLMMLYVKAALTLDV